MRALRGRIERAPEAGAIPALAAPAGAKAEDVGDEEVVERVAAPPVGGTVRLSEMQSGTERSHDAKTHAVPETVGMLFKQEVSLLLPTVIYCPP